MARIDEWAEWLSGNYQGWMRPQNGEWEDMIGSVKLAFTPAGEDSLYATITSLEFGAWAGGLQVPSMAMEGSAGQGGTHFACAFETKEHAEAIQSCFVGGIFESRTGPLFDLQLTSEWRRRLPERP